MELHSNRWQIPESCPEILLGFFFFFNLHDSSYNNTISQYETFAKLGSRNTWGKKLFNIFQYAKPMNGLGKFASNVQLMLWTFGKCCARVSEFSACSGEGSVGCNLGTTTLVPPWGGETTHLANLCVAHQQFSSSGKNGSKRNFRLLLLHFSFINLSSAYSNSSCLTQIISTERGQH